MEERALKHEQPPDGFVPLVGRRDELKTLLSALSRRKPCLISGPAGIGKTRLIQEALSLSRQPCVSLQQPRFLHQLLVELAQRLFCAARSHADVRHCTSVALKPIVLGALRKTPPCIVLEDVADADPRMYRFLQQVYYVPGVCLVVAAKSRDSLGYLRKLLWDPREEIALKPLNRRESLALFEAACGAFRLDTLDLDGFKSKVLTAAQGNPGQILTMCRLANRPEYQHGRHIKFSPVYIDALTAFLP